MGPRHAQAAALARHVTTTDTPDRYDNVTIRCRTFSSGTAIYRASLNMAAAAVLNTVVTICLKRSPNR